MDGSQLTPPEPKFFACKAFTRFSASTSWEHLLSLNFLSQRPVVVHFSRLELSSDAGILFARQAEEQVQVCRTLAICILDWRDPHKITHSLEQLVSQRVYQLVGGYEDAVVLFG
jgi:hypothetical protein